MPDIYMCKGATFGYTQNNEEDVDIFCKLKSGKADHCKKFAHGRTCYILPPGLIAVFLIINVIGKTICIFVL
jgi:hypothetical protein